MLLGMLSDMLLGHPPDMDEVALARSMLLRHVDPYQPLPATLRSQMEGANLAVRGRGGHGAEQQGGCSLGVGGATGTGVGAQSKVLGDMRM